MGGTFFFYRSSGQKEDCGRGFYSNKFGKRVSYFFDFFPCAKANIKVIYPVVFCDCFASFAVEINLLFSDKIAGAAGAAVLPFRLGYLEIIFSVIA